jgi:hypothetical protein
MKDKLVSQMKAKGITKIKDVPIERFVQLFKLTNTYLSDRVQHKDNIYMRQVMCDLK